jgi:hypothetical protein
MDELANLFVAGQWIRKGKIWTLRAYEACDPVQGITGKLKLKDGTVIDFPDYVLPNNYFGPAAPGARVDREGALKEAGDLTPEGYQIAARMGTEQDVFAAVVTGEKGMAPHVMARKKTKGSRTSRRLDQLANILGISDPSKIIWE